MSKNNLNNILIFIIVLLFMYCINEINKMKKINEQFTTSISTTDDAIKTAVKQIYLADVEAIRILSNFAIQLTQGGTTVPGNVTFQNKVTSTEIASNNYYLRFPDNTISDRPEYSMQYTNKNYGMFLNTYLDASGNSFNDTSTRNECNVSINSWNGLQFKDTNTNNSKIWFDLRLGNMNAQYLTIVNPSNYSSQLFLNGDSGVMACNGGIDCGGIIKTNIISPISGSIVNINGTTIVNINGALACKGNVTIDGQTKPTAVNIDPNCSAITFNHGDTLTQTNRWVIRADNPSRLDFEGWKNNTWNRTPILSINQNSMVTINGSLKVISTASGLSKTRYVNIDSNCSAITFNHDDITTHTNRWVMRGDDSGEKLLEFQGWKNNRWSESYFAINQNKSIMCYDIAGFTSDQNIIFQNNVNSQKTINSNTLQCNTLILNNQAKIPDPSIFPTQTINIGGHGGIVFARITRPIDQANNESTYKVLCLSIEMIQSNGFEIRYMSKGTRTVMGFLTYNGTRFHDNGTGLHDYGGNWNTVRCTITGNTINLTADYSAYFLSAVVTFF